MTGSSSSAAERLRRQRIFHSPLLDIGVFQAPAGSDLFGAQPPTGHYAVAFPQTAVRIRPASGPEFVTDRNLVTLYEPDDAYDRGLVDPRGDTCTFIAPAPELAREFASRGRMSQARRRIFGRPFELCPSPAFRRQRRLLLRLETEVPVAAAAIEEEALAVLDEIAAAGSARGPARCSSPASSRRHAARAREFLACHYPSAPSLSRIAEAAACSPFHLSRVFRRHFGMTLNQYRTELAVRDAHDQITGSDRRLLDIALDLGFASHSHFTATFRRRFGILPSAIRAGR